MFVADNHRLPNMTNVVKIRCRRWIYKQIFILKTTKLLCMSLKLLIFIVRYMHIFENNDLFLPIVNRLNFFPCYIHVAKTPYVTITIFYHGRRSSYCLSNGTFLYFLSQDMNGFKYKHNRSYVFSILILIQIWY